MNGWRPGLGEAMAQFRAAVDGAVSRGRRAAAEAKDRDARFRQRTRELADRVRQRAVVPERRELTPEGLREAAVAFRSERNLSVEQLPDGEELLANSPEQTIARATPNASASSRNRPEDDDDEDFFQERILR